MFGNNYGGNTNNNYNQKSVNTRIRTFYSDLSALQLSYWNENISVKINPIIPGGNADGIRQYDYNRKIMTAITTEKAIGLYKKIKKNIIPVLEAIENGEQTSLEKPINAGVQIGQGTLLFIQYKMIDDTPTLDLALFTNVVDGKTAPENVFRYRFNKVEIVTSLDEETMEMETSKVEAEFLFFYEKLKNIATVVADAAHSVNMAKPHGGNNNYASGNNNGNYNGNNYHNNSHNSGSSSYSAPESEFNASDFPFN